MDHKLGKKHLGESASGSGDVWSTLPVAILHIIVEKLEHFRDRLSLASVCKDWRIPVTPRPVPWLATFPATPLVPGTIRSASVTFEFYEPGNPRPYRRSILLPEIGIAADHFHVVPKIEITKFGWLLPAIRPPQLCSSDSHVIVEPTIEYSKLGWLLVSFLQYKFGENELHLLWHFIFVYHPFSARFMSLPDLYTNRPYTAVFSGSDPTSPECVFFVLVWQRNPHDTLEIHTWSQGQRAWKKHEIRKYEAFGDVRSVTWLDGIFYWCSRTHMESFDPSNGEWKEIAQPWQLDLIVFRRAHELKLFKLNGEIFLLIYKPYPAKKYPVFFKFDPSAGSWIRGDDIFNDRVQFISIWNPSCYSILARGESENMGGNRVFRMYRLCQDFQDVGEIDKDPGLHVSCSWDWLAPVFQTPG